MVGHVGGLECNGGVGGLGEQWWCGVQLWWGSCGGADGGLRV